MKTREKKIFHDLIHKGWSASEALSIIHIIQILESYPLEILKELKKELVSGGHQAPERCLVGLSYVG